MASTYPTSLDAFTNPTGLSLLTSPDHAQQHSDINDAVEALEAKVAIGATVLGTYTDYASSVTISNVTLGNAVILSKYARVNNFVHYYGVVTFGTTSSVTGTGWNLRIPINCSTPFATNYIPVGNCVSFDASSGAIFTGDVIGIGAANLVRLRQGLNSGTYASSGDMSTSVPMVWTTSDKILWNIYYEAA